MSNENMNMNEEVTWIVTSNTVKDRMIESSLIHRFSDSKTFQKSTHLLNKLIEKYRGLNRYQDYVKMKKLVKQKIHKDIEIEDNESFGEDDYSILHKMNLLSNNYIKELNDTISDTQNSFAFNVPNEMSHTDIDLPKENRKRLRMLRLNDEKDDEVPVMKKQSKTSPKRCLKTKEKMHPIVNKKNNSNSFDTNNVNASLEENINHTKAVLDIKDINLLPNNRTCRKQIDNFAQKMEFIENTANKPSMQTNHSQLLHKYHMEEDVCQDLSDAVTDEVVDNFEISNISRTQEIVSHDTNDSMQNIESTSNDIKEDTVIKKQGKVTSNSNVPCDNMNLNDITNDKSENDKCSDNSVVLQSLKSPPKVKSTEIINKRYKIINKENSYNELPSVCFNNIKFLESSTPLSSRKSMEEVEVQESEGYEDSISSSVLSQSEKRIRQIKFLNLSLENTSSSSEDEIQQQKDNLSETTVLNDSFSKTLKKNAVKCSKIKLNKSHDIHHKEDKSFHSLQTVNNSTEHQHDACIKNLTRHKKISTKNNEPNIQTLGERPRNLESFIENEGLVKDTIAPAFALPDFSEDEDIFLVDMPITVQLANLQGQRILLKNKLLKLGTNKYEILQKDISVQSCIFSTGKDNEPYKMINIKPRGSILVKRKLFPLSVSKYSKYDTKSYHNVHKHKNK